MATDLVQSSFKVRGVYFHDGFTVDPRSHAPLYWGREQWQRELEWLAACGLNTIEFATMLEFSRVPSTDMERQKIADRLRIMEQAHASGMRFGYLVSNTVMSTVPEGEEPAHQLSDRAETLCPRQPGNFERTMAMINFYLQTYREADFFEEFAADWGGCGCGLCDVSDYLRYVRAISEQVSALNHAAKVYANTWCIAYWGEPPQVQNWRNMYDREISGSREVIAALPSLPANVHLGLPCHHLYRPLAFSEYGGRARTPVFPLAEDVANVHAAGREVLAWPHFVMDDDAFRPAAWGIVHSEVRYIQALLRKLRAAGIDNVMGNLYLPLLQLSNTFAYGRLLENPDAEPRQILADFARVVAHPEDAAALAEVLTWVENNSYWQEQMPADGKLPNLPCTLTRAEAQKLAGGIRANSAPALPLPLKPEEWLADLRRSLERMDWVEAERATPVGV